MKNIHQLYNLSITIIVVMFSILLSSCSPSYGLGPISPGIYTSNSQFENDKWLILGTHLINKYDNTESKLLLKDGKANEEMANSFGFTDWSYNVEFEEDSFKLYTFVETFYFHEGDRIPAFFDCVLTYDYKGGYDIERTYLSDMLTEEQAHSLYRTLSTNYVFSFEMDALWSIGNHYTGFGEKEQKILEHAEMLYNSYEDGIESVSVVAKYIDNDILFSVTIVPKSQYLSGVPIMQGIRESQIKRYNSTSKEIETVFEYNKKNEMIVDFDENGIYAFDDNGNFKYYDLKSKATTLIHKFSDSVHFFQATDNYFIAHYSNEKTGHFLFVYEKGKGIVADAVPYKVAGFT